MLCDWLGKLLIVCLVYCSFEYNCVVGGVIWLKYFDGVVFDIVMVNYDLVVFEVVVCEVGFFGFGFYL